MKKKYLHRLIDLKTLIIALLLLTGCETESPKNNQPAINNPAANKIAINNSVIQQSSSLSSAPSNKILLLPAASSAQHKNTVTQQSSVASIQANIQTSFSSTARASHQSLLAFSSSSIAMASASAPTLPTAKKALVGLSGTIKVTGKNGEVLSPEGVIVNLEPTTTTEEFVADQEKHQYEVQMQNKTYMPKLMTIKQNDQVSFTNNDKIKHNVFSTSAENRFDLGTYGEGKTNKVAFKTSGVVKVYCNIHPEMALFISVSQHNYSHITDKNGFFEINNLPAGEYRLSAWHIRGEIQQIVNLQGLHTKKDILLDTESYVPIPHKNKYDEAYKVKSALFQDEFY